MLVKKVHWKRGWLLALKPSHKKETEKWKKSDLCEEVVGFKPPRAGESHTERHRQPETHTKQSNLHTPNLIFIQTWALPFCLFSLCYPSLPSCPVHYIFSFSFPSFHNSPSLISNPTYCILQQSNRRAAFTRLLKDKPTTKHLLDTDLQIVPALIVLFWTFISCFNWLDIFVTRCGLISRAVRLEFISALNVSF